MIMVAVVNYSTIVKIKLAKRNKCKEWQRILLTAQLVIVFGRASKIETRLESKSTLNCILDSAVFIFS